MPIFAEDLDRVGLNGQFDLLFTNNALYHTMILPASSMRLSARSSACSSCRSPTSRHLAGLEQLHKFDFDLNLPRAVSSLPHRTERS